ncbi:MAG: hypothetical protein JWQ10_4156 [Herbaspirillum sp.]|nr:hypothetical protein [Herbaspirillum sp.]
MKIYIACGLTHVPRSEFAAYVGLIEKMARYLTDSLGAEVKYALKDSDPQLSQKPFADRTRLCYVWDKEMVESSDVVIAEASYPSTGLGIELQIASAKETPILMMFKLDEGHKAPPVQYKISDQEIHTLQLGEGYISLMALGIPSVFKVFSYADVDEACAKVGNAIDILNKPIGRE